jgi:hypothetical protein
MPEDLQSFNTFHVDDLDTFSLDVPQLTPVVSNEPEQSALPSHSASRLLRSDLLRSKRSCNIIYEFESDHLMTGRIRSRVPRACFLTLA